MGFSKKTGKNKAEKQEQQDQKRQETPEEKNQDNQPSQAEEKEKKQEVAELRAELEGVKESIQQKQEENEQLVARLQRAKADFANYKKRVEKSRFQDKIRAQEEIILELLPVLDNFERALQVNPKDKEARNICKGVEMIYKQLLTLLQEKGMEEIEALDQPFDPHFHEAVERVWVEEKPAEMVVEVIQKGYRMGEKVLRPSLVKVNKGGDEDE